MEEIKLTPRFKEMLKGRINFEKDFTIAASVLFEGLNKNKRLIWVDCGMDLPEGDFNIVPIDLPLRKKNELLESFYYQKKDIIVRDYFLLSTDPLNISNLYIYTNGEIKNIQDLTDKELKFIHNVPKLLLANTFGV